jgi:plastocyanin
MTDLFYVFGGALTVLALVLSFIGLRSEGFPGSGSVYGGVLAVIGLLVVASCGFAIALSREEAEHREHEIAEFEAEQEAEAAEARTEEQKSDSEEATQIETEPQQAAALELTSPAEGDLLFEPDALESPAGEITIAYTNPSEVPHNVAIEGDGQTIAESETVTGGDTGEATAPLEPGEYVFFCAIPGHRESGMEGTLTVE